MIARRRNLTDTIRESDDHEYERERARIPLAERLKPIQAQFCSASRAGGLPADKAFFDDLYGDA